MKTLPIRKKFETDWLPTEGVKSLPDGWYYVSDNPSQQTLSAAQTQYIEKNQWQCQYDIQYWRYYAPIQTFTPVVGRDPNVELPEKGSNVIIKFDDGTIFSSFFYEYFVFGFDKPKLSEIVWWCYHHEFDCLVQPPAKPEPAPEPKPEKIIVEIGGADVEIEATDDPNRFVLATKKWKAV